MGYGAPIGASFQGNCLCRAQFLAAETGNTGIRIDSGEIPAHGQRGNGAGIDTGLATRAQIRIDLRPQECPRVDHLLHGFVAHGRFAAKRGKLEAGQYFQFPDHVDRTEIVVPQSRLFRFLQKAQSGGFAPHHGRDDGIQGHGVV